MLERLLCSTEMIEELYGLAVEYWGLKRSSAILKNSVVVVADG